MNSYQNSSKLQDFFLKCGYIVTIMYVCANIGTFVYIYIYIYLNTRIVLCAEYKDVSQNGLPFVKVNGIVENDTQVEEALEKVVSKTHLYLRAKMICDWTQTSRNVILREVCVR